MTSTSNPKKWGRLPRSYAAIQQHYRFHCMDRYARELRWFAEQPSLRLAVARAAVARGPHGRRLPHQWRLLRQSLAQAHRRLVCSLPVISACTTFLELHDELQRLLAGIPRLADVYFYDTALRIGAHLSVNGSHLPVEVFLHQGSLEGAKKISAVSGLIPRRSPRLNPAIFPTPLCGMQSYELENLLCIYKSCLR
jgi:hypothetical protein